MIQNDKELEGTLERINYFSRLVAQMRITEPVENFHAMSSSYLAEIEKMNAEALEYLKRHASESATKEAA
jgi:hypothetical protein